ncbi:MAG TPA: sulfotransferase [Emcibacteraceae bacterium]|nr:sulfotransferase [Emcibacteraceae bacterium]
MVGQNQYPGNIAQLKGPTEAIHVALNYANQGMVGIAEKICLDIIQINKKYHPAYHLLGQFSFQQGHDEKAEEMLRKAISIDENRAIYHRDLAEIIFFRGNPNNALQSINRSLKLNLNDPKSHYIAALALSTLGEHLKAIEAYKTAIKLNPSFGAAYNNLGTQLEAIGHPDQAKEAYIQAININPNNAEPHNNLAVLFVANGDIKDARRHLETAIKIRPQYIEAHHNLSPLKKYKIDDEHIMLLEELALNAETLSTENQARLYFTLGKAYSDLENLDKAFHFFDKGNKIKRASFHYDEKAIIKLMAKIKDVFSEPYFKSFKKYSEDDQTAIFIVGMPRSGSTLIEQILSSHSDVHAGGELLILAELIKDKMKNFPWEIEKISDDELSGIGKEYLRKLKALNPDAKRIVNKLPSNFHYVGLIAKILPGAKIINSKRNPLDCCLSNYTRLFSQPLPFVYELGELGRYYNRYQDLMDHWHKILPKQMLIDVHYEDVVDNLENQARELIKFIGLEWQDQCLNFYQNKRSVHTASADQVRKPIYKTAIEKWRPYEKYLTPLIDALNEHKL